MRSFSWKQWLLLGYLDVETMEWDDYNDGFIHIRLDINYCPYCGRKLDDN